MKLKALDSVHISSVKPDPLLRGEVFEMDDATAKIIIDRGLAAEVKDGRKAAPKPQNKAAPKPANKAAPKPRNKAAQKPQDKAEGDAGNA